MALTLPDDNEIDRMGKADVALAQHDWSWH